MPAEAERRKRQGDVETPKTPRVTENPKHACGEVVSACIHASCIMSAACGLGLGVYQQELPQVWGLGCGGRQYVRFGCGGSIKGQI